MPRRIRMQYRKGEVVTALQEEFNKLVADVKAGRTGAAVTAQKIADQEGKDHDGNVITD